MSVLSSIVQDLTPGMTAESYAAALEKLTGTPARVRHLPTYSEVYWDRADLPRVQAWIDAQLRPGKPGAVRVDFGPAVYPPMLKKALPVALGLVAAGFLLAKLTK